MYTGILKSCSKSCLGPIINYFKMCVNINFIRNFSSLSSFERILLFQIFYLKISFIVCFTSVKSEILVFLLFLRLMVSLEVVT